ncbi:MAG: hypothetical protein CM1200mP18_00940 [Gammaproteobacteria bacterium]|nr:MAG: hypothetical protein CM1200mP18_00940 [Gammaproteobacteria bacterium]
MREEQHAFWTRVFQEDFSAVMECKKEGSPGFDGGVLSPLMDVPRLLFMNGPVPGLVSDLPAKSL